MPFLSPDLSPPVFRRDYAKRPSGLLRVLLPWRAADAFRKTLRDRRDARRCGLVDGDWYRREYPDAAGKGIDPVRDFLSFPNVLFRKPNPDFDPLEYASLNFDVNVCGIPPAVHYVRDGMREGRSVSTLETADEKFPEGTVELRREFSAAPPVRRRTAVFASHSSSGRIGDAVLHYLRGLAEVVDNVVFAANNPVFPDEVPKLEGLVRVALFRHHGCYDFGSYKAGWFEAKALGLLGPDVCDELVLCNDSCFGPVFPFSESFAEMERRRAEAPFDFWGMTGHVLFARPHVQSYFYAFGPAVLESGVLDRFFGDARNFSDRGRVVYYRETALSAALADAGLRFETLVPQDFSIRRNAPPIKFPVTLLSRYRMPLLKAKTLRGESREDLGKALEAVRRANPALAAILPPPPRATTFREPPPPRVNPARTARENHLASLERAADRCRAKRASGRPLRTVVLVSSSGPFRSAALCRALSSDPAFDAVFVPVPDFRCDDFGACLGGLRARRAELLETVADPARVLAPSVGPSGDWPDPFEGADAVFYDTAEDASDFRYNPHYAVGRGFLPILPFDPAAAGPHPPEKEFARQNYAYFWKVVFGGRGPFECYGRHSLRKGANAVLAEDGDAAAASLRLLASPSAENE